MNEDAFVRKSW